MKNIIIYGGAFDPVHNGHMQMAIKASEALSAEVFFVPARISVWKKESAKIEDKIAMLELAIKEYEKEDVFKISLFEANSDKETNYSIDTVKHFVEQYPDHKLYLLIGTDQVNSFHKWKDCDEIASLTRIIYFNRPGLELSKDNVKRFNMKEIHGEMVDMSSTDFKELKNLSIPYSALQYVIENNLYFTPRIRKYMSEKRFQHSFEVAKLAYEIAVANDLERPDKYFIAGILHDIGKEMNIDKQTKFMEEYYPRYVDARKPIFHQFVGAHLAMKDFGVEDEEILGAIMFHTTGKADMTDMEKVIYAADKIEPTRGFDSRSLIDSMKKNIKSGFVTVLKANLEFFHSKSIDFDNELTKTCFDYYL